MNERTRKTDGLRYRMNANPGARQPSGLAPNGIEFLRQQGGFVDDPPPDPIPFPSPDVVAPAPRSEPVRAPSTVTASAPRPDPQAPAPTPSSPPAQPRPSSKKRARQSKGDAYALPPTRKRQPSRSNHFRLPADVEAHLKELAAQYDCSRTHVVCSVISSEWQRLRRRQSRSAKSTVTTA
jgi:hypothetical protein